MSPRAITAALIGGAVAVMLTLALASVSTLYWLRGNEITLLESRLSESQASARKARQQLYDLQEADREGDNAEINRLNLKVWEVQQKLEKCKP